MKKAVNVIVLTLLLSVILPSWAYADGFTQQDRERLTRVEDRLSRVEERLTRVEEGLKSTNQRMDDGFKSTNQRMDDGFKSISQRMDDSLKNTNQRTEDGFNAINHRLGDIYGLMYVLIGGMLTLVGFVLWDRRTTLAPAIRKNMEIEERAEKNCEHP
ncbi:MAG: hypothetical protein HQK99_08395 [Nitrospirae bacterium]|nr:hypothetical protein [Nitrospirota bacterium]